MATSFLNDTESEHLESLASRLVESFQGCKLERKKLHELEWDSDEPSILGEAEVLDGQIAGIVHSMLKWRSDTSDSKILAAKTSLTKKMDCREVLTEWKSQSRMNFPSFCRYLDILENFRSTALSILLRNE